MNEEFQNDRLFQMYTRRNVPNPIIGKSMQEYPKTLRHSGPQESFVRDPMYDTKARPIPVNGKIETLGNPNWSSFSEKIAKQTSPEWMHLDAPAQQYNTSIYERGTFREDMVATATRTPYVDIKHWHKKPEPGVWRPANRSML